MMFARLNRLQKYRQPNISCVRSFENRSPSELTLLSPRGLPCSRTSTLDHFGLSNIVRPPWMFSNSYTSHVSEERTSRYSRESSSQTSNSSTTTAAYASVLRRDPKNRRKCVHRPIPRWVNIAGYEM